jgi:hypothetical protein
MVNRDARGRIARQTLEILERGWYTLPDGTTVSLGDSVVAVHLLSGGRSGVVGWGLAPCSSCEYQLTCS